MDALRALRAMLGSRAFWTPKVLNALPHDAVEAFQDQLVVGRPGQARRLEQARQLKAKPVADRIQELKPLLSRASKDPDIRRAIAWGAGLCPEISAGAFWAPLRLNLWKLPVPWIPDGLELENLAAGQTGIVEIPPSLVVRTGLVIYDTRVRELPPGFHTKMVDARDSSLELLGEGVEITDCLQVAGSPLAQLTDQEIRSMAPGVTGLILR